MHLVFASAKMAVEMGELYWHALTLDVPFTAFSTDRLLQALSDLGQDVEIVHGLTGQESVISAPPASLVEGAPVQVAAAR